MARPLRLEHAGAVWHVTSRGNERKDIYRDDADRERFLHVLDRVATMFRWRIHSYVLMTNHYHLLVETPEPNLSRGMRQLNGIYSQAFNRRHGRVGHLMQGRFKGILVERESHLLELLRYIVLNPVRCGMVRLAWQYRWSSYRATAGLQAVPPWLQVDWTLGQFSGDRSQAHKRFRLFVSQGKGAEYSPWEDLFGQIYLGGGSFREKMYELVSEKTRSPEIPREQREANRPEMGSILAAVAFECGIDATVLARRSGNAAVCQGRRLVAYLAQAQAARSLTEIGAALGVTSWTASKLASTARALLNNDNSFCRRARALESRLRGEKSRIDVPETETPSFQT